MISVSSAGRPLAGIAGLRDEAMELGQIAERGAEGIDSIRSRVNPRSLGGPARTETATAANLQGQPTRCRTGAWPVVDGRARLAGAPGDREAISGGTPERESPGNGAASLWKGSIRARKWRPA